MSSNFGIKLKLSIFGQSHSQSIGVVLDGLPAGEAIDMAKVQAFMARRAPGQSQYSTKRKEPDLPQVLSGLIDGKTCGAPLAMVIENTDMRSGDYAQHAAVPRPSHADYAAHIKHGGHADVRGGGHFSGRLTAPLCFAGAVAMQILNRRGVQIGAHIASIHTVHDQLFNPLLVNQQDLAALAAKPFPTIDDAAALAMGSAIESHRLACNSVGGVVECAALGLPVGIGEPLFDGLENRIATALFAIPAVKGVEFGAGFALAAMTGLEANDGFTTDPNGNICLTSNNCGGILGGLSSGAPLVVRAAFKPTPSIGAPQASVNLQTHQDTQLVISGRHDPCVVLRAVPCVEAALAVAILDLML